MAGSVSEAALKAKLMEPTIQRETYDRAAPRNETLHNRSMRVLRCEVEGCMHVVTADKYFQFRTHKMGYMPKCLREDIVK